MDRGPSAPDKDQPVLQHPRPFRYRALAVQQLPQMACLRGIAEPELLGFITAFGEIDASALAPDQHLTEALCALLRDPHRPVAKLRLSHSRLRAGGRQRAHTE